MSLSNDTNNLAVSAVCKNFHRTPRFKAPANTVKQSLRVSKSLKESQGVLKRLKESQRESLQFQGVSQSRLKVSLIGLYVLMINSHS